MDRRTGYRTRSILCVPLRNREGAAIGVTQTWGAKQKLLSLIPGSTPAIADLVTATL